MKHEQGEVVIFELSDSAHEKGLVTIASVLSSKNIDLVLVATRDVVNRLSSKDQVIFTKIHACSRFNAILKGFTLRNKNSVFLHHTFSVRCSLETFIISLLSKKNIFFIRNANSWIKFKSISTFGVINFFAANFSSFLKKIVLRWEPFLLTEKENIKNYLEGFELCVGCVIPFGFFDSKKYVQPSRHNFSFVVPGAIDVSKKNLLEICNAIDLIPQHINVKVILLGRPVDVKSQEFCEHWKMRLGSRFEYYSYFIPHEIFEDVVANSAGVISSYYERHECSHLNEVYGTSKGSAVDGYAISYGRPLLVNMSYRVDPMYSNGTIKFEDHLELSEILQKIACDHSYRKALFESARACAENYTISNVVKNCQNLFQYIKMP